MKYVQGGNGRHWLGVPSLTFPDTLRDCLTHTLLVNPNVSQLATDGETDQSCKKLAQAPHAVGPRKGLVKQMTDVEKSESHTSEISPHTCENFFEIANICSDAGGQLCQNFKLLKADFELAIRVWSQFSNIGAGYWNFIIISEVLEAGSLIK